MAVHITTVQRWSYFLTICSTNIHIVSLYIDISPQCRKFGIYALGPVALLLQKAAHPFYHRFSAAEEGQHGQYREEVRSICSIKIKCREPLRSTYLYIIRIPRRYCLNLCTSHYQNFQNGLIGLGCTELHIQKGILPAFRYATMFHH